MEKHFVLVVMLQLPLVLLPQVKTINAYEKTQYIISQFIFTDKETYQYLSIHYKDALSF